MSRIKSIAPDQATGKAKELLERVGAKLGMVPNMTRAMANAPAVLDGYLAFSVLWQRVLCRQASGANRTHVCSQNNCDYCLAAHTTVERWSGLA